MGWAELNDDLLCVIAKKLKHISDFVRLRAVCKSWQSTLELSMVSQLPCFIDLTRQNSCTSKKITRQNSYFDLQFHQVFSETVQVVCNGFIGVKGKIINIHGSLSKFILLEIKKPEKPWLLINPLTGFHVYLPFNRNCSQLAIPIYFGQSCFWETNPNNKGIDVAFMFRKRNKRCSTDDDFEVCLWRYDDMKWTSIDKVQCCSKEYVTFCNGRLGIISRATGDARVIDINTGKVSAIRGLPMRLMYLVEAGKDLLCVFRSVQSGIYQFEVFQLEDFGINPRLRKLSSIGNWVIFISTLYNAICLKTSDCEGLQSNCIYLRTSVKDSSRRCNSIVRYDISNNTTEMTISSDPFSSRWFVPSLV